MKIKVIFNGEEMEKSMDELYEMFEQDAWLVQCKNGSLYQLILNSNWTNWYRPSDFVGVMENVFYGCNDCTEEYCDKTIIITSYDIVPKKAL